MVGQHKPAYLRCPNCLPQVSQTCGFSPKPFSTLHCDEKIWSGGILYCQNKTLRWPDQWQLKTRLQGLTTKPNACLCIIICSIFSNAYLECLSPAVVVVRSWNKRIAPARAAILSPHSCWCFVNLIQDESFVRLVTRISKHFKPRLTCCDSCR